MVENLVHACRRKKVSRLVHCSTALVVGKNPSSIVSHDTNCLPVTTYEKTKYQMESLLLDAINDDFNIYIIRPTLVVGPSGQNLKKICIIGLVCDPARLHDVRRNRVQSMHEDRPGEYTNEKKIINELENSKKIFKKYNWPIIDVTRKSVEETAASIIKIFDILNSK